jgi:thiol:disulfide interchange protein DsbD
MVAVTVSVFGAKETKSRWQGLGLTSAFVFGMVVMFVSLGLVAAFTGTMFGSVLQNRWVVLAIAALFAAMALSMFGAFELSLPTGLLNRLAAVGGIGFRGAFLLGLVSGLVASPCTGPVLTGILAWIATTKNLVLGSVAMTSFALGLGVPFFAVGAFALELPKSGRWMLTVKYVLGTVLLVVALYFAGTTIPVLPGLVPTGKAGWLLALSLVAMGILFSFVLRVGRGTVRTLAFALAIGSFVIAGFVGTTKLSRTEATLSWEHGPLLSAMERARREGRPMLVDFTATWCGACKELDKLTFSDPAVKAEAGRFLAVKIDATHDDDPSVSSAMQRLSVRGLPTVVLIDGNGTEVRRFTDFVAKGPFLEALRAVP